jgi:hypothetical protein
MRFWGPGDLSYLKANYFPSENPDVWLPKKIIQLEVDISQEIKIIKEGFYYLSDLSDISNLSLDGQKVTEKVYLSSGLHTLANSGPPTTVTLNYDTERNKL